MEPTMFLFWKHGIDSKRFAFPLSFPLPLPLPLPLFFPFSLNPPSLFPPAPLSPSSHPPSFSSLLPHPLQIKDKIAKADEDFKDTQAIHAEVETEWVELAKLYAKDGKTMKPEEFFVLIHTFVEQFEVTFFSQIFPEFFFGDFFRRLFSFTRFFFFVGCCAKAGRG
jgi:hypothetical protein